MRGWECSSIELDRHATDAGSISQCGKRFFSQSQLSVQDCYSNCTTPLAIACINICAHIKDPLVHVRVRWIMVMLNTQHALQVGECDPVAAVFPWGKQPKFPMGEIQMGQYSYKINKKNPLIGNKKGQKETAVFLIVSVSLAPVTVFLSSCWLLDSNPYLPHYCFALWSCWPHMAA